MTRAWPSQRGGGVRHKASVSEKGGGGVHGVVLWPGSNQGPAVFGQHWLGASRKGSLVALLTRPFTAEACDAEGPHCRGAGGTFALQIGGVGCTQSCVLDVGVRGRGLS